MNCLQFYNQALCAILERKPVNIFESNIREYEVAAQKLSKTLIRLSILRAVIFLASAVLITALANERLVIPLLIVTPLCIAGFGLTVRHYNRINYLQKHTSFLKEINQAELLRQENKLSSFDTGRHFLDRDHPYIADLDVFGSHSLFQLLNRTTTESGQLLMAEWLSVPAPKATIFKRQEAVKELSPKLEWRQHFQAAGMHFRHTKIGYERLAAWIDQPARLLPHQTKYLMISIPLSVLSTLGLFFFLFHLFTADWFFYLSILIILLLINNLVLNRVRPIAEKIIENTHQNIKILGGYKALIRQIESEKFHSEILYQLQLAFMDSHYSAVKEINKLKKILEVFLLRGIKVKTDSTGGHLFYHIFNLFLLFDVYWIILTEKWKVRNRDHLHHWASAIGEFEVLSSIAGFHYASPPFTFPEIREEPYYIDFQTLGHPLIAPQSRVCNHFHLEGRGEIAMITGSNMAGKSTFLRTVGVNLVLAFMGAPCCAQTAQVSNMKIFTSMRTQDNLEEGTSSFYAELKRVEQLLRLIQEGQAIFFLLDEMFKGTNSQDRHKGGVSLIKQLSELNAFGIISTHDLELAKLAGKQLIANNFSFNSAIQAGEMTFNYTLTPGICNDFNASELMKRSGIKILSGIEEV